MSIVLKAEFPKKLSVVFVAAWSEADVSLLSVKRQRFFLLSTSKLVCSRTEEKKLRNIGSLFTSPISFISRQHLSMFCGFIIAFSEFLCNNREWFIKQIMSEPGSVTQLVYFIVNLKFALSSVGSCFWVKEH